MSSIETKPRLKWYLNSLTLFTKWILHSTYDDSGNLFDAAVTDDSNIYSREKWMMRKTWSIVRRLLMLLWRMTRSCISSISQKMFLLVVVDIFNFSFTRPVCVKRFYLLLTSSGGCSDSAPFLRSHHLYCLFLKTFRLEWEHFTSSMSISENF